MLRAANLLIQEHGYPRIRMEDIAEQAGVAVGTVYLYFQGKADLFAALVAEQTERLLREIAAAHAHPGDVTERMIRGLDAYLSFAEANVKGFLYFRYGGTVDTDAGSLTAWAFEQHARALLPLVQDAMDAGVIRRTDAMLAAQAILGAAQHIAAYWLEHEDAYSREEARSFLFSFLSFGLARR